MKKTKKRRRMSGMAFGSGYSIHDVAEVIFTYLSSLGLTEKKTNGEITAREGVSMKAVLLSTDLYYYEKHSWCI